MEKILHIFLLRIKNIIISEQNFKRVMNIELSLSKEDYKEKIILYLKQIHFQIGAQIQLR